MLEILYFRLSIWEENKLITGTAILQSLCSYRKYHSFFCKTRVQRYLWMAHSGLFTAWKLTFLVCRVSLECNSERRACPRWLSHVLPTRRSFPQPPLQGCTCHGPDLETCNHQGASDPHHSWPWWARLVLCCMPSCAWPLATGQPLPAHGLAASSGMVPAAMHLCGLDLAQKCSKKFSWQHPFCLMVEIMHGVVFL